MISKYLHLTTAPRNHVLDHFPEHFGDSGIRVLRAKKKAYSRIAMGLQTATLHKGERFHCLKIPKKHEITKTKSLWLRRGAEKDP